MVGERAFHERRMRGFFTDQRAVDIVAEFMAQGCGDRAGMMRGVYENHELALRADLRPAVKAAQRKSRPRSIGLGAKLEFSRAKKILQMRNQLRAAEIGQAFVGRCMLLDVS